MAMPGPREREKDRLVLLVLGRDDFLLWRTSIRPLFCQTMTLPHGETANPSGSVSLRRIRVDQPVDAFHPCPCPTMPALARGRALSPSPAIMQGKRREGLSTPGSTNVGRRGVRSCNLMVRPVRVPRMAA